MALLGIALLVVGSAASETRPPDIYFLRSGEIWRTSDGGKTALPLTRTKGMIQRFEISRHGRYLAYEVVVDSIEAVGDFEPGAMIPKVAIDRIVVADRRTLRILKRIGPDTLSSDDRFVYIERWLAPELLAYCTANGVEVSYLYKYDPARDTTMELKGTEGWYLARYSDETLDGSLRVTMEADVGSDHLVLEDLNSGARRELLRAHAFALALSPDGGTVAGIDDVEWPNGYRRLWVTDLEKPHLRQIAAVPFSAWSAGNTALAWSADGRHLLTPWGQVVTAADSLRHRSLNGTEFVWYGADEVLVTREGRVVAVDINSGATRSVLDNATNVRVQPR